MKKFERILSSNTDKYSQVQAIKHAKVPIIKFFDQQDQINMDVSFNKLDGLLQLKEVEKGFLVYPEMKPLIFLLKLFLRQREMNSTY
jgi:non-canonical poly(A) RNA polymerase PAPD5/7